MSTNPKKPSRYPSQYEAELILETNKALNDIHTGYASDCNTTKLINSFFKDLSIEYEAVFNSPDSSPWKIEIKNKKRVIRWRKEWN